MESWFLKSIIATLCVTPTFIAIPFFKGRHGVDPMVFLVWYFAGSAAGAGVYTTLVGKGATLFPSVLAMTSIFAIGVIFGTAANGNLFQAVGLAPNPGLPPVIYATSSMIVFALSIVLFASHPDLFKPVSAEPSRLAGILIVLFGLYLLAGGKLGGLLK
jgi:hypothetical protein